MARFTPNLKMITHFSTAAALIAAAAPGYAAEPCKPLDKRQSQDVAALHPTGDTDVPFGFGALTGDGWSDVVVLRGVFQSPAPHEIAFLLPGSRRGVRDGTSQIIDGPPALFQAGRPLVGEFNGNVRDDIYVPDVGQDLNPGPGTENQLLLSTDDGQIRHATDGVPELRDRSQTICAADIDGDADFDICNGSLGRGPPQILINDAKGRYSDEGRRRPEGSTDTGGDVYTASVFADVNGDGGIRT